MKTGRPPSNGLYRARQLTCPCGTPFVGRRPSATYCSEGCRKRYVTYGRNYGQYEPRAYGIAKA